MIGDHANFQTCEEEIPRGSVTSYGHIARLLGRGKLKPVFATLINITLAVRCAQGSLQIKPSVLGQQSPTLVDESSAYEL